MLAKRYPLSKLFSKGRTVAIQKGNEYQLGLLFLLEACQRNAAGWSTAADQRMQSFHFPIVIHQSLDPAARALKRQAPSSLSLHALEHSTGSERVDVLGKGVLCTAKEKPFFSDTQHPLVGSTRRRGNHMHDRSRFQRDIDDVTGVSLSLSLLQLLLLTKVTHAQYRKRFRASYNKGHSVQVELQSDISILWKNLLAERFSKPMIPLNKAREGTCTEPAA